MTVLTYGCYNKLENQKKEHFRELLGFYLGSILHEDWKKDDEIAYLAASDEKKAKNWEVGEDGILRKFKPVNGEVDGKSYVDRSFGFESLAIYRLNAWRIPPDRLSHFCFKLFSNPILNSFKSFIAVSYKFLNSLLKNVFFLVASIIFS